MAAPGTSGSFPDQGFSGRKNLQRKQLFIQVTRVLVICVQDFLPEADFLSSFTLPKPILVEYSIPSNQIQAEATFCTPQLCKLSFWPYVIHNYVCAQKEKNHIILHMPPRPFLSTTPPLYGSFPVDSSGDPLGTTCTLSLLWHMSTLRLYPCPVPRDFPPNQIA